MTWDEQIAEICKWCGENGLEMHVPKIGAPYFTRKPPVESIMSPATDTGGLGGRALNGTPLAHPTLRAASILIAGEIT